MNLLAVLVLVAGWAAAELRRREAERQRDALRRDAIQILVRANVLLTDADRLIRHHHATITTWQALHAPGASDLQEAASYVYSVNELTREGLRLLDRRSDGRVP